MASELTKRAMLVELHIKHWSDSAIDKEVSEQVASNAGVSVKVGKYIKSLLPKEALKPVKDIKVAARAIHMDMTMPWDNSGVRLLPVDLFEEYERKMRSQYENYNEAVRVLTESFPDYMEIAKENLGPLYKDDDYLPQDRLQEKFEFTWCCMPVPDSSHFIADLPKQESERIKADIEAQLEARIKGTVHDLYLRLGKAVANMSERLEKNTEGKPKTFHKSTLDNLREICDVLPQLNITNDAGLANLCSEVKQAITDVDAGELREGKKTFNEEKFARTRDTLSDISSRFAGYFGTTLETKNDDESE